MVTYHSKNFTLIVRFYQTIKLFFNLFCSQTHRNFHLEKNFHWNVFINQIYLNIPLNSLIKWHKIEIKCQETQHQYECVSLSINNYFENALRRCCSTWWADLYVTIEFGVDWDTVGRIHTVRLNVFMIFLVIFFSSQWIQHWTAHWNANGEQTNKQTNSRLRAHFTMLDSLLSWYTDGFYGYTLDVWIYIYVYRIKRNILSAKEIWNLAACNWSHMHKMMHSIHAQIIMDKD